jgi:hypothetical protein
MLKMIANSIGAVCTAVVMLVFIITKFMDGAWIILVITPIFISILLWINRHYSNMAKKPFDRKLWGTATL